MPSRWRMLAGKTVRHRRRQASNAHLLAATNTGPVHPTEPRRPPTIPRRKSFCFGGVSSSGSARNTTRIRVATKAGECSTRITPVTRTGTPASSSVSRHRPPRRTTPPSRPDRRADTRVDRASPRESAGTAHHGEPRQRRSTRSVLAPRAIGVSHLLHAGAPIRAAIYDQPSRVSTSDVASGGMWPPDSRSADMRCSSTEPLPRRSQAAIKRASFSPKVLCCGFSSKSLILSGLARKSTLNCELPPPASTWQMAQLACR